MLFRGTVKQGKALELPGSNIFQIKSFRKGEGELEGERENPFPKGFPSPPRTSN